MSETRTNRFLSPEQAADFLGVRLVIVRHERGTVTQATIAYTTIFLVVAVICV
jgi:hypothetical protein